MKQAFRLPVLALLVLSALFIHNKAFAQTSVQIPSSVELDDPDLFWNGEIPFKKEEMELVDSIRLDPGDPQALLQTRKFIGAFAKDRLPNLSREALVFLVQQVVDLGADDRATIDVDTLSAEQLEEIITNAIADGGIADTSVISIFAGCGIVGPSFGPMVYPLYKVTPISWSVSYINQYLNSSPTPTAYVKRATYLTYRLMWETFTGDTVFDYFPFTGTEPLNYVLTQMKTGNWKGVCGWHSVAMCFIVNSIGSNPNIVAYSVGMSGPGVVKNHSYNIIVFYDADPTKTRATVADGTMLECVLTLNNKVPLLSQIDSLQQVGKLKLFEFSPNMRVQKRMWLSPDGFWGVFNGAYPPYNFFPSEFRKYVFMVVNGDTVRGVIGPEFQHTLKQCADPAMHGMTLSVYQADYLQNLITTLLAQNYAPNLFKQEQVTTVENLKVYPNPSPGTITVRVSEGVVWRIYDVLGRAILSGVGTETIELESGVYLVQAPGATTKFFVRQ